MSDQQLLEKVAKLPDQLKSEVGDFIDFLLNKQMTEVESGKPTFGSGKGLFVIKPGFDEPLADFNDYK